MLGGAQEALAVRRRAADEADARRRRRCARTRREEPVGHRDRQRAPDRHELRRRSATISGSKETMRSKLPAVELRQVARGGGSRSGWARRPRVRGIGSVRKPSIARAQVGERAGGHDLGPERRRRRAGRTLERGEHRARRRRPARNSMKRVTTRARCSSSAQASKNVDWPDEREPQRRRRSGRARGRAGQPGRTRMRHGGGGYAAPASWRLARAHHPRHQAVDPRRARAALRRGGPARRGAPVWVRPGLRRAAWRPPTRSATARRPRGARRRRRGRAGRGGARPAGRRRRARAGRPVDRRGRRSAVRAAIGDAPRRRRVTCFEVIEHLRDVRPAASSCWSSSRRAGFTVVLSVPNDAFWALENPYHQTMWGEGAFEELRRLLPPDARRGPAGPADGSAIALAEGASGTSTVPPVALRADARPVALHRPRSARGATQLALARAAVARRDLEAQRRWERQREANLAMLRGRRPTSSARYIRSSDGRLRRAAAPAAREGLPSSSTTSSCRAASASSSSTRGSSAATASTRARARARAGRPRLGLPRARATSRCSRWPRRAREPLRRRRGDVVGDRRRRCSSCPRGALRVLRAVARGPLLPPRRARSAWPRR